MYATLLLIIRRVKNHGFVRFFEEEKERIRFLKFNLDKRIKKAQIDIINKNYHITFNKTYFSKYVHQF